MRTPWTVRHSPLACSLRPWLRVQSCSEHSHERLIQPMIDTWLFSMAGSLGSGLCVAFVMIHTSHIATSSRIRGITSSRRRHTTVRQCWSASWARRDAASTQGRKTCVQPGAAPGARAAWFPCGLRAPRCARMHTERAAAGARGPGWEGLDTQKRGMGPARDVYGSFRHSATTHPQPLFLHLPASSASCLSCLCNATCAA